MGDKPVRSVGTAAYDALTALLVELRTEAGLTQDELAARMGRHFTWVSKVERGTRRLDVVELCEVADALGLDPADVVRRFRARPPGTSIRNGHKKESGLSPAQ